MTSFAVPEMQCGRCTASIHSALTQLDPAAKVEADIRTRIVRLETAATDAQVLMTLNDLGYAANVRG